MKKLIAVPFDRYVSDKTDQGLTYNIVDQDQVCYCQCRVSHLPYVNHDLLLDTLNQAPSNVRNALKLHLDNLFGLQQWSIITRFSISSTNQSQKLQQIRSFDNDCKMIGFDQKQNKLIISSPQKSQINGVV